MSRYFGDELREMAKTALAARDAGDGRFAALLFAMMVRLRLSPDEIERRIERLAGAR